MDKATVVICNYNKEEYLLKAIESAYNSSGVLVDIIVVDNNSTDNSVSLVREKYKDVRLIELVDNVGGAGGFSCGMQMAVTFDNDFIVLLDNDALLESNTLIELINYAKSNHEVGIVGPAICKLDDPSVIQEVGAIISSKTFNFELNYAGVDYSIIPKTPIICDYVPACCMVTRKEVIEKVGVFDSDFFLYWDDIDWCTRARELSYKVVALPKVRALHKGGGAVAINTSPRYYYWRNRIEFFKRHKNSYNCVDAFLSLSVDIDKNLFSCIFHGMNDLLPSIEFAISDARNEIMGKISNNYVLPNRKSNKNNMLESFFGDGVFQLIPKYDLNAVDERSLITEKSLIQKNKLIAFLRYVSKFESKRAKFTLHPDDFLFDVYGLTGFSSSIFISHERNGEQVILCDHLFTFEPEDRTLRHVDSVFNFSSVENNYFDALSVVKKLTSNRDSLCCSLFS